MSHRRIVEPRADLSKNSRWTLLQDRRARAHRAFCVQAANGIIEELRQVGVDVVVFGSLAENPSWFRVNSDIDLCVLSRGGISLGEVEEVVRRHLGQVKCDLIEFGDLASGVRQEVVARGVRHVQ